MNPLITRRQALAVSGGAVLTGCSPGPELRAPALVSISKAAGYGQGLYEQIRRIITEHRINVKDQRIVLKPNLVEFDPGTTINTHPMVVHAVYEAFRALGAADVRIAEGPGHRRITLDLADAAAYFSTVPKFDNVFTDLNLDDVAKVTLKSPVSKLKFLYLPNTVLGCDLLVSLPKMKTHHWVGATLSMKNLFGVVPGGVYGWPKNLLHWAGIPECIADLYRTFPKTFAIVDGIDGMEGNGPIQGTPKHAGVLVAGSDLAAVDATCCRIMGINPDMVSYLQLVGGRPEIKLAGEPLKNVTTAFSLIPEFNSIRPKT